MSRSRFEFPSKISRKQAGTKLADYALYADHLFQPRPRDLKEAQALVNWLTQDGFPLVEEIRNYRRPVRFFENTVEGATWYGSGPYVAFTNETGETAELKNESGELSSCPYQSRFESACTARERAVREGSYDELLSAITQAIASFDGFFNLLANRWNRAHPNDPIDTSRPTSISQKFDAWFPKITGHQYRKGDSGAWSDFERLRKLRNRMAIHPDSRPYAVSDRQFARDVDAFRSIACCSASFTSVPAT